MTMWLSDKYALMNDSLSVDLDAASAGNQIKFTVTSSVNSKSKAPFIQQSTFPSVKSISSLTGTGITNCNAQTTGTSENNHIFLCNSNVIAFISFDQVTTKVISSSTLKLSTEFNCQSLSGSNRKNIVYVICMKPDATTLTLVPIDLSTKKHASTPLDIVQDNSTQVLSKNLKVLVDDSSSTESLVYIYETETKSNTTRFRQVQHKDGSLVDLGYYSTLDNTIINLYEAIFIGLYFNGKNLMAVTRDVPKFNRLQQCYKNNGIFDCGESVVYLEQGEGVIRMKLADPTLGTSNKMYVAMASLTSVSSGIYDPDDTIYRTSVTVNMKGTILKDITDVFPIGDKFVYVVGPAIANVADINGLLKLNVNTANYQQITYQFPSTLSFVRQDFTDPTYANYYQVVNEAIYSYTIKKNMLTISTNNFDVADTTADYSNIQYTISCTAMGMQATTFKFNLYTMLDVNSKSAFTVPNVKAYLGSNEVDIQTNTYLVNGNAPVVTLTQPTGKDAPFSLNVNQARVWPKITNSTVGMKVDTASCIHDRKFLISNDALARFYWTSYSKNGELEFSQSDFEIDLSQKKLLASTADNGRLVTVISRTPAPQATRSGKMLGQQASQELLIEGRDFMSVNEKLFDPIVIPFNPIVLSVRIEGFSVLIYAIGTTSTDPLKALYLMNFDIRDEFKPQEMTFAKYIGNGICPTEISWIPKDLERIFVTSVCNSETKGPVLYQIVVNFQDTKLSFISNSYVFDKSQQFATCVQDAAVTVIDYLQPAIYAIDINQPMGTTIRYNLPFKQYGIDKIQSHSCNQEDGMLLVVGSTSSNKRVLIAYRTNDVAHPELRVHSVTEVDAGIVKVAAAGSDSSDRMVVMLFGSTLQLSTSIVLYPNGPHLYLDVSKATSSKSYDIEYTMTLIGDQKKLTKVAAKVDLISQPVKLMAELQNPDKKILLNGASINLDNHVIFNAPYRKVDTSKLSDSVVVSDRVTRITKFADVTDLFDDATFYQDYIFGVRRTDSAYQLQLNKDTRVVLTAQLPANSQVTRVEQILSDGQLIFLAAVKSKSDSDRIYAIYVDGTTQSWKSSYMHFDQIDLLNCKFAATSQKNKFVLAGFSKGYPRNIAGLMIEAGSNGLSYVGVYDRSFDAKLATFDIIFVGEDNFILIVLQQSSKQANIVWLAIDTISNLVEKAKDVVPFIKDSAEVPMNMVISCQSFQNDKDKYIQCVSTGNNVYSYLSRYDIMLDDQKANKLVTTSSLVCLLANIVNLSPIRVTYLYNIVLILTKNIRSVTKPSSGYFSDDYVVLVYNIATPAVSDGNAWNAPVRHAYKVLTSEELEVPKSTNLANVTPRLYVDNKNDLKVGLNIDESYQGKKSSLRAFNLSPLEILVKGDKIQADASLPLVSIDANTYQTPLASILTTSSGPTPQPKPEDGKKTIDKTLIGIALLIVFVLIVAGLCYHSCTKKDDTTEEKDIAEVDNTIRPADVSSVSGNYSKI